MARNHLQECWHFKAKKSVLLRFLDGGGPQSSTGDRYGKRSGACYLACWDRSPLSLQKQEYQLWNVCQDFYERSKRTMTQTLNHGFSCPCSFWSADSLVAHADYGAAKKLTRSPIDYRFRYKSVHQGTSQHYWAR